MPAATALARKVAPGEDAFLDDMQRRACRYFMEQAGAKTGEVLDRAAAGNTTGKRDPRLMASIAATGFGLTALCIADQRRYAPHALIQAQVRKTLQSHLYTLPHEHGFLYHFNDVDLGGSFIGSEVSPIDTTLFLCGVLMVRAHFQGNAEIWDLSTRLYERVDWPWMLNGGQTFALGWRAGKFLPGRWNHYCELMMMNLLALGSRTHPVDPATWDAWSRPPYELRRYDYIGGADPLFVHQYSHAYFDFRGKRDKYANYFENSIAATRAHKAFCLDWGKPYSEEYWGISASDSQMGYRAWGGPAHAGDRKGFGLIDGSVVPNAAAGSLAFTPAECVEVLQSLKSRYPECWGRYGFCDAFHPEVKWYDLDVLGIDLGIGLLMSENLRTGFVWETFWRNPEVGLGMRKAGFQPA